MLLLSIWVWLTFQSPFTELYTFSEKSVWWTSQTGSFPRQIRLKHQTFLLSASNNSFVRRTWHISQLQPPDIALQSLKTACKQKVSVLLVDAKCERAEFRHKNHFGKGNGWERHCIVVRDRASTTILKLIYQLTHSKSYATRKSSCPSVRNSPNY